MASQPLKARAIRVLKFLSQDRRWVSDRIPMVVMSVFVGVNHSRFWAALHFHQSGRKPLVFVIWSWQKPMIRLMAIYYTRAEMKRREKEQIEWKSNRDCRQKGKSSWQGDQDGNFWTCQEWNGKGILSSSDKIFQSRCTRVSRLRYSLMAGGIFNPTIASACPTVMEKLYV